MNISKKNSTEVQITMTNAKKRKIFSASAVLCLAAGFICLIQTGDMTKWAGISFFALTFVLMVINSIGTIYYTKGTKCLQGDNPDIKKAMPYFEKAVRKTLDPQAAIIAATLLVQYGDMEKGRKILEEYETNTDKKLSGTAKISLSMYWWIKRDLKKATEIAEDVYNNSTYRDRNLYINLLTFYLEEGKYKEFKKLLKDAKEKKVNVPATIDLEASYYMTQSDWAKCGMYTRLLFADGKPRFMDPYLHEAMVQLHYGEWENAVKALKELKENVTFTNASVYTESQIDTFIAYAEDKDTRWGLLEAIDTDPTVLIRREMPEVESGLQMPSSFPSMPDFTALPTKDDVAEKDEGDIDTDLTDDDEEWLRKHEND